MLCGRVRRLKLRKEDEDEDEELRQEELEMNLFGWEEYRWC